MIFWQRGDGNVLLSIISCNLYPKGKRSRRKVRKKNCSGFLILLEWKEH
jgi:hypothetical protein